MQRTADFATRDHGRYWWFQTFKPAYDPPIFANLSDDEWELMASWYEDSEKNYPFGTGECAVPAMSFIHGLVAGNSVKRVVQLGHFIGFSSLLLGFQLRRMGVKQGLFSVDINPDATGYTQSWIDRAGLDRQVHLELSDSAQPELVDMAHDYLGGPPQLIFIDSSHQYEHTLAELAIWYPALPPGGLLLLHDVSLFAATFDHSEQGGVPKALKEWAAQSNANVLLLNGDVSNQGGDLLTYTDGCGLGVIQKPFG